MSVVDISVEGRVDPALVEPVEALARQAIRAVPLDGVELSILLCDDATIRPMNHDWRGRDQPTDVLSFSMDEGPALALAPGQLRLLGDLVISVDTARRQAQLMGHPLLDELAVLVVHGLLHLLGYDHETGDEEAQAMRTEEARLLAAVGGGAGLVGRGA